MPSPAPELTPLAGGTTFTLSNGTQITLPPHDQFYRQITVRNVGLIADADQQRLRSANILIAGCGSVGGAAVEPLVRIGAESLTLAEPDGYDLHNINRQSVRLQDIGRNKAEVFQENMRDINPYASIAVEPHGITPDNVERVVQQAAVVLDAVDVTTRPPLRAKFLLHQAARKYRKPVIAGYDIAGLQMLLVYDYRDPSVQTMFGRVVEAEIDSIAPFEFLNRVLISWPVPPLPLEIIPVLLSQLRGETSGFPQIVYTCHLFGVLATRAVLDVLAGRPVRQRTLVDVNDVLRPAGERARVFVRRVRGLLQLNAEFRRARSQGRA
ncbi:MAG TPA: ThiF family adenylyltransferase [Chloroflexota bacterium]|nr:ThiF family adenylyltransferase [Chloroflexota bacterium]